MVDRYTALRKRYMAATSSKSALVDEIYRLCDERDAALANWEFQKLETDSLRAENAEMRKLLSDVCPPGVARVSESLDKKIRRFLSGEGAK